MEIVTKNLGIRGLNEKDVYSWEEILDYIDELEIKVEELTYDNNELKEELDRKINGYEEPDTWY